MRLVSLVLAALLGAVPGSATAQEYVEYASRPDGFTIIFPTQPTIVQTTFKTQTGTVLPARVYTSDSAAGHYQVTVADYTNIHQLAIEKARNCPPGAETCNKRVESSPAGVAGPRAALSSGSGAVSAISLSSADVDQPATMRPDTQRAGHRPAVGQAPPMCSAPRLPIRRPCPPL